MDNKIYAKVFLWMFIGLLFTFGTGYFVSLNENMLINVFSGGTYLILAIVELVLVIILSARAMKMKSTTAKICFLLYSFVSGLTFSSIFIVYKITSIIFVFLIAAILFGIFGILGYFTKLDLSKVGIYLLMGLFAVIICSIINIFIGSSSFDLGISIITILIFLGFTAYDMQKIKHFSEYDIESDNLAIIGALTLYLDFINIFIRLLSLFGKNRD